MSGIEELKELTTKLQGLLEDPQPGLFTWRGHLSEVIYEIGQYGGQDIIMGKPNQNRTGWRLR